jgi:hypothetical protein
MLDYVGQLLDDPLYSDVEFVFPNKAVNGKKEDRRIYACKRLLNRADYFNSSKEIPMVLPVLLIKL